MKLKKKRKKDKGVPALGVGWYREDQWPLLLQHSADRENLNQTYAKWLEMVNKKMEDLIVADFQPLKIPVDVHDMVRWCRGQGIAMDGEARAAYVAMQTRAHFG